MNFPDYFPENCPLIPSRCEELIVYRAVDNKTNIEVKDFEPLILDKKKKLNLSSSSSKCRACGLSVYTNIEELQNNIEIVPSLFNKEIIPVQITKDSGRVLETPPIKSPDSSHITWWPYSHVDFLKLVVHGT